MTKLILHKWFIYIIVYILRLSRYKGMLYIKKCIIIVSIQISTQRASNYCRSNVIYEYIPKLSLENRSHKQSQSFIFLSVCKITDNANIDTIPTYNKSYNN